MIKLKIFQPQNKKNVFTETRNIFNKSCPYTTDILKVLTSTQKLVNFSFNYALYPKMASVDYKLAH